jgi:hypothetical protein
MLASEALGPIPSTQKKSKKVFCLVGWTVGWLDGWLVGWLVYSTGD